MDTTARVESGAGGGAIGGEATVHIEELNPDDASIDEAIDESFPASDPPAVRIERAAT